MIPYPKQILSLEPWMMWTFKIDNLDFSSTIIYIYIYIIYFYCHVRTTQKRYLKRKIPYNNFLFWKASITLKCHQLIIVLILKTWGITLLLLLELANPGWSLHRDPLDWLPQLGTEPTAVRPPLTGRSPHIEGEL